jgi:uncharacterized protein
MAELNKVLESPLFENAKKAKHVNIGVAILLPPLVFIAMQLIGGLIYRVITAGMGGDSSPIMASLLQNMHYIISFALIILFVFAWVVFIEKRKISTIGFPAGGALKKYVMGMVLAVAMFAIVTAIQVATGNASVSLDVTNIRAVAIVGVALAFIGFIVQGGAEEITFRGWQVPVIGARYGPLAGILISGVVFGLLHVIAGATMEEIVIITIIGIFFALYAVRNGDIWSACGLHAVWNWLSGNVLVETGTAETPSLVLYSLHPTGQYFNAIYGIVFIAAIVVVLAVSIKYSKKVKGCPC